MAHTLLLYSTNFGLSKRICERMQARLQQAGREATVRQLAEPGVDPADFDAIVIGASIRYGKHSPDVLEFIRAHKTLLETRPSALFSVNLVARKPLKGTPETNPYLQRLIAQSPWKPQLAAVFAGELDYSRYRLVDKLVVRLIMWITRGPTDLASKVEYTDWQRVDRFAEQVARLSGTTVAQTV